MANANKASKMTEQTNETQAAAAVAAVETTTPVVVAVFPKEDEFQTLLVKYNQGSFADEAEKKRYRQIRDERDDFFYEINKSKGSDLALIKQLIAKQNLKPADVFPEEILKSLYATVIKKEPKEATGKRNISPAIYSIWQETGPKARAFSIGSSDKKAEALTVFELVDTWEELEKFKVNTPEINEYLQTEKGQAEITKGKALFAEFKKLKPAKVQGKLFKTFEERKAAKA